MTIASLAFDDAKAKCLRRAFGRWFAWREEYFPGLDPADARYGFCWTLSMRSALDTLRP